MVWIWENEHNYKKGCCGEGLSLNVFLTPYKIDESKLISHKEFDEFIKGTGFKGRNNYVLKDLKAKLG